MDDLWVVLPHLGAGGAQKVGLLAAEHFSAKGYRVKVLTLIHGHPVLHDIPEEDDSLERALGSLLFRLDGPEVLRTWVRGREVHRSA